jgi:hypothetical protein
MSLGFCFCPERMTQEFGAGRHGSLNLQLQRIRITAPRYNILISGFLLLIHLITHLAIAACSIALRATSIRSGR